MSNIIHFTPRFKNSKDNLEDFIDHSKNQLAIYEEQGGFNVDQWHTAHAIPVAMRFSIDGRPGPRKKFISLPEPFILFAKSYVRYCQSLNETTAISKNMVPLKAVCRALIAVHGVPDILFIDGLVQKKVELLLDERYPGSSQLYIYGGALERLYEFLIKKGIAPALPVWKRPWKRQKYRSTGTDQVSKEWRKKRCPSQHQMLAMADCFRMAKETQDMYWSSVFTLLMFAPGRAAEPTELTIDCLQKEDGHYFVSWESQKGYGGGRKWVPEILVDPVKEAVARLIEIGKPARDAAKFAYNNPGKFLRHSGCITPKDFREDAPLNALQFARAMNMDRIAEFIINKKIKPDSQSAWGYVSSAKGVKKLLDEGPITYERLAIYVATKYQKNTWPKLPRSGHYIWDALLLHRFQELSNTFTTKLFSWTLPNITQMNEQLNNNGKTASTIFHRFGLVDEDGGDINMTTHQFRVWLNTVAMRGGMDQWLLAQWSGRAKIQQNKYYDLRTEEEKIDLARNFLTCIERPTALEAAKLNLPVSYQDLGINRLGIADPTQYGFCVHDYAMAPCTKGGDCMICKDHICLKGLPPKLESLKRLAVQVASQFDKAKKANKEGIFGTDRWMTYFGWKLAHIYTLIRGQEDENIPDGTVLRIPAEHDPSSSRRALYERGYNASTDDESIQTEINTIKQLLEY